MTNINPAPSQTNFSSQNNMNPVLPNQAATVGSLNSLNKSVPPIAPNKVSVEQPHINKAKGYANHSNRPWIIFLIFLALIIGFWIGYFVNEHFYQNLEKQENLIGSINQPEEIIPPGSESILEEPINNLEKEPISNPNFDPNVDPNLNPNFDPNLSVASNSATEPEPAAVEKGFIFFRGEQNFLNDGLNFVSGHQCAEDEIAMLTAIEDDHLTIQINQWTQQENGEYVAELIDFEVRDQECIEVRLICPGLTVQRCFSLNVVDGVYNLDYEFREEGAISLPGE
jgi:hypothetical protein